MKKITTILLILIALTSYSQSVFETLSEKTYASLNDFLIVKNPGHTNAEKISIGTLTEISDSIRASKDDSIYNYCGLSSSGKYVADESTNFLTASDFTSLSLSQNIVNSVYILDSIINVGVRWESGTGTHAVALKSSTDSAQGNYSVAIGRYNESIQQGTFTHGIYSASTWKTGRYYSSGSIMGTMDGEGWEKGSAEGYELMMFNKTTDATEDTLLISLSSGSYMNIPVDAIVSFNITLTASSASAGSVGISSGWVINGIIKNIAGDVGLVGSIDTVSTFDDTGATTWAVSVEADDTNDNLLILVTGEAAKSIYWVAKVTGTITGVRDFDIDD